MSGTRFDMFGGKIHQWLVIVLFSVIFCIAMALNIPAVESFDSVLGDNRSNAGPLWDKWVKRLENYMLAINVTADARKRAILLHQIGPKSYEDFTTIPDTGATYASAKQKLNEFFRPKINVEFEKAQFRMIRQKPDVLIDAYHTRIRQAAATCNFRPADLDAEIKSHMIQTMRDSKVRKKGLSQDMT